MSLYFPPLIPAKAGTQFFGPTGSIRDTQEPIRRTCASRKHWVPASAGMSGNL